MPGRPKPKRPRWATTHSSRLDAMVDVERRRSTNHEVPTGTTESNPRFQPWVASGKWPEPRRGERKDGAGPVRSFVPDGTRFIFAPQPSDESLGYFRASLRDVESRHAKRLQGSAADGATL